MTRRLSDHVFLSLAHGAGVAVLTLFAVAWWTGPMTGLARVLDADRSAEQAARLPSSDLARYDAIKTRPLFAASRRPDPAGLPVDPSAARVSQVQEAQSALFQDYSLQGTVVLPQDSIAIMRQASTGRLVALREGWRIGSWEVQEIGAGWLRMGNRHGHFTVRSAGS